MFQDAQLIHTLQLILEILGTFAFAISGIRHAAAKHFDLFGGYVCGVGRGPSAEEPSATPCSA